MDLLTPLAGGLLIGLSAATLHLLLGRVAGISGITSGALSLARTGPGERDWRTSFLVGLVLGGALMFAIDSDQFASASTSTSTAKVLVAGLLVGFGTRLGSGCTSGHGVCGLSRLSPRSLTATLTFIAAGAVAVFFTS